MRLCSRWEGDNEEWRWSWMDSRERELFQVAEFIQKLERTLQPVVARREFWVILEAMNWWSTLNNSSEEWVDTEKHPNVANSGLYFIRVVVFSFFSCFDVTRYRVWWLKFLHFVASHRDWEWEWENLNLLDEMLLNLIWKIAERWSWFIKFAVHFNIWFEIYYSFCSFTTKKRNFQIFARCRLFYFPTVVWCHKALSTSFNAPQYSGSDDEIRETCVKE